MKRLVFLLVFLFGGLGFATAATEQPVPFYLQLVHGNDQATPPVPDGKAIGPKLSKQLRSVFKWEHFWELKRDTVALKIGEKARKKMSAEREVEIERRDAKTVEIRIFRDGKLKRTSAQSVDTRFAIFGGEKGPEASWFIVVRRDEPQPPEKD